MASKIKVDQIEGSTGTSVTIPTGHTFTVTDGMSVAGGGTGLASFTAGDILYATGSTTLAKLGKGTAEQVLAMNSGATAPDWGSVDLTVLPTITVAKGGTNLSSFAAGDVLYATGSTTLAKLGVGSAADVLTMNAGATAPEWAAAGGGTTVLAEVGSSGSSFVLTTAIPSTAKVVYVNFDELGSNSTGELRIVLGDSGGYETSGYDGTVGGNAGTGANAKDWGGESMMVVNTMVAISRWSGVAVLTLGDESNNVWHCNSNLGADATNFDAAAGRKALSGALTSVKITTSAGSFDEGSASVSYST